MDKFRAEVTSSVSYKTSWQSLVACTITAALLLSCRTTLESSHASAFAPSETNSGQPIEIRFYEAVADTKAIGEPIADGELLVTPAIEFSATWRDPHTLEITPQGRLTPSTRYTVKTQGALRTLTKGYEFSFVHRPVVVYGVRSDRKDSFPIRGEFALGFNQDVKASDVERQCRLIDDAQREVGLTAVDTKLTSDVIPLRPKSTLTKNTNYRLSCRGVAGASGNEPLQGEYLEAIRTRPDFVVADADPASSDVDPDDTIIELTFSTPVDVQAVRKAIRVTPEIEGSDAGWMNSNYTYRFSAPLDTNTTYQIELAGLTDVDGEALAKPFRHSFTTGNATPRVSMDSGSYVLETSAKGYPVWSRNVSGFDISCAAIDTTALPKTLAGNIEYTPYPGSREDKPLEWAKLGLKPVKIPFKVEGSHNKWRRNNLDFGAMCAGAPQKRGVYLAEIYTDQVPINSDRPWRTPRRQRVLVNVTNLGLLLKVGSSSGLAWVTDLATGKPVAGATVTVLRADGSVLATTTSDAQGLAKLPGASAMQPSGSGSESDDGDSWRVPTVVAMVQHAGDAAVVTTQWNDGLESWNFDVNTERSTKKSLIRGFIQSDRGIYRPGDTVHFKGLVREITMATAPRLPRGKTVAIEVSDSRGSVIHRQSARLSPFGGFSFDLGLIKDAALGDYTVRATIEGQSFLETFSVEEFRPVTFELAIRGKEEGHRLGQPLEAFLRASYLFGAPVDDADVTWNVRRRAKWITFDGYDGFSFESSDRWYGEDFEDYGEFLESGDGKTDANGEFKILAKDDRTEFTGAQDFVVEMTVTDASAQSVSKSAVIAGYFGDFVVGVRNTEWVAQAGKPFPVEFVALKPTAELVSTTARVTLVRNEWVCRRIGGFQGRTDCSEKSTIEQTKDISLRGVVKTELMSPKPGSYTIRIEAKDSRGRSITASSGIWLTGRGDGGWAYNEESRMKLIANKRNFKPGDTATVVAQSSLKRPTALISVERDGVIDARVIQLESSSQALSIPLRDTYAPNVFASVAFVQGRSGDLDTERPRMQLGLINLPVDSSHKQLDVKIEFDRDQVRPGEKVAGTVTVTSRGKPVVAELALSAADEGVLQLINYRTPNPMNKFYLPYGLGVDNGTNYNRIARLRDARKDADDEGGDSGGGRDRTRSKFVSSAYWKAAVVTDASGLARFEFTAPDNLTAFRMMAVAADPADRFGSGDKRFTVKKPLMAMPALARVYQPGDETSIGVVVHNYTGKPGVALVKASATGMTLGALERTIQMPATGTATAYFPSSILEVAESKVSFDISMGGERDAVELTIPVRRPRTIDIKTIGSGRLSGPWEKPIRLAKQALPAESELRLTIDRSGLSDLEPSLRYLVEYPYGCLEQTLSRFIPLTKAKDLAEQMGITSLPKDKVDEFIAAGVRKVLRHQQYDGHFSLWPDSNSYPHLTVYAMYGLREAQRAGVAIDPGAMARGYEAIEKYLASAQAFRDRGDMGTAAMGLFLLADRGKVDAKLVDSLYARRETLPVYGQAFLLRALVKMSAPIDRISTVKSLMLARVAVGATSAAVLSDTWSSSAFYMTSDTRSTAQVLGALVEVDATNPVVSKLIVGLKEARRGSPYWNNTQENLWSLIALADYARLTANATTTVTVKLGASTVAQQTISGNQVYSLRIAGDKLGSTLRIESPDALHFAARMVEVSRDPGDAVQNGFKLKREYLSVKGAPLTEVKAGSPVRVRITIENARFVNYAALVDPLPGGLEPVNPRLATSESDDSSSGWFWSHTEMRDDRVMWFADRMKPGTHVVEYLTRATTDGTFRVMPTTIEAMYQPDIRGRTAATTFVVKR